MNAAAGRDTQGWNDGDPREAGWWWLMVAPSSSSYNPRWRKGITEGTHTQPRPGEIYVEQNGGDVVVRMSGAWTLGLTLPSAKSLQKDLHVGRSVTFRDEGISDWDSGLLLFLVPLVLEARSRKIATDTTALPSGVKRLLNLALAVPPKAGTSTTSAKRGILGRIGVGVLGALREGRTILDFMGEVTLGFLRLLRGSPRFRRRDLLHAIQESGVRALGIVGLISFLVGLILAYMGSVQLEQFGAQIYVADLVALGMLREMSAMMTGIVMAGRTGAAYAAQLGTMMVNEEIDSLRTVGLSPIDFLVLPRILALVLMMPLLAVYADFFGLLGGYLIGVTTLDLSPALYWDQTFNAIHLSDFLVGMVKSVVIGAIVAVSGCLRGMECGRSASDVGIATTSAVVTSIVLIIISEAIFAVLLQTLGI